MVAARNSSEVANHYAKMRVGTAPKQTAIYLLHEKCIYLIGRADVHPEKRREYLNRAQNIVAQLQSALVVDDTTSQSLHYLYDYCWGLLESGNDSDLADAYAIMAPLRNTFQVLLKTP